MHEWRKRVKDLRYAAEMLQRDRPGPTATVRAVAAIGRQREQGSSELSSLHRSSAGPTRSGNCSARSTTWPCSPP